VSAWARGQTGGAPPRSFMRPAGIEPASFCPGAEPTARWCVVVAEAAQS